MNLTKRFKASFLYKCPIHKRTVWSNIKLWKPFFANIYMNHEFLRELDIIGVISSVICLACWASDPFFGARLRLMYFRPCFLIWFDMVRWQTLKWLPNFNKTQFLLLTVLVSKGPSLNDKLTILKICNVPRWNFILIINNFANAYEALTNIVDVRTKSVWVKFYCSFSILKQFTKWPLCL